METSGPLRVVLAGPRLPSELPLRRRVGQAGALYETARDGKECLAIVRRDPPDAIFIELGDMQVDCIEAIRFIRAEEESRHIAVVVVAGAGDVDGRREALAAGATEFLTEPFEESELCARVDAVLALARLRRDNEKLAGEIGESRLTDAETGALQRHYIDVRVVAEVKSARRHQHPLSLIAARLDLPFGGDRPQDVAPLLRPAADAIKNLVRDEDLVARYGPTEFLVVLPHTDSYGSLMLAERIRAAIESLPGAPRRVTASVGVASCQKAEDFLRDPPLKRARGAMERAAAAGGNRVVKQD